ncbi:DUF4179 domain-containing protein [Halobacillus amylolyticus]|uniref:DUF4179 domain-containing protein n=1 Tax=Halobacillus amylolyticus TaxID=2932259 RepID=A0ABY4HG00_9BACI|nr:DUF4179 domain-containing protein [Halobacillus amylolyticus]UOR13716.1 DUF4179 domain-containing protein [Halobacillus amylolyticus]
MKEKLFREKYEEIEIPKEDVNEAIRKGIRKVDEGSKPKKKVSRTRKFIISTAAAITLLSSSFIVPSVSHVMADVPLVGKIYMGFNDLVGRNLASQQLITKLNETASHGGIDVTVTSAYYDGAVIGVTFDVTGDVNPNQRGKLTGFYEIFNGDKAIADSKELVHMEQTDNGFTGQIQLHFPGEKLPADTTFPLEFLEIGDEDGVWKFDVPIKQLPNETVMVDKESSNKQANVKVYFDSIIAGKASTAIDYTAIFPAEAENDQVRLEAYDDHGNTVHISMDGIDLEKTKENNQVIVKGRSIVPQELKGKTDYIEIHPKVALQTEDQFVKLNQKTPVQISSPRQDHSINLESINKKDNKLVIDFQINEGKEKNKKNHFYKDVARHDVTLVKESEKDIYKKPIDHSIKVLSEGDLRFRSTFDLSSLGKFNSNDYVIRVSLGTLSSNIPVKLEPVKIDLRE